MNAEGVPDEVQAKFAELLQLYDEISFGEVGLAEKMKWYKRRITALEQLLAVYRKQEFGVGPSEKLHIELARTAKHIDSRGNWIGG